MPLEHWYTTRNDTTPALRVTLKDGAGVAINVTGAIVKFSMADKLTGRRKVNEGTVTLVTAASGIVEYPWQAGDLDTVGDYLAEWEITYAGGAIQTVPSDMKVDGLIVHVRRELG